MTEIEAIKKVGSKKSFVGYARVDYQPSGKRPSPEESFQPKFQADKLAIDFSKYHPALFSPQKSLPEAKKSSLPKKEWTVMVYSGSDNNLMESQYNDVDEMERVGSGEKMNLLVQFDHGEKEGGKRYYLHQNNLPQVNSPVLEELGNINMADPGVLADFIEWGIKKYPAEHYMLVVSDHGRGWNGLIDDESYRDSMTVPKFGSALKQAKSKTGVKLDVLGMDACLTGSLELAYEVKDAAQFLVASEETEHKDGWPYEEILAQLPGKTPQGVAGEMVEIAKGHQESLPTLAATDLAKIPEVGAEVKNLAKAIINTSDSYRDLKDCFIKGRNFGLLLELRDIYFACKKMSEHKNIKDEKLKKAALGVMQALDNAIINEQHHEEVFSKKDSKKERAEKIEKDYRETRGLNVQGPSWRMLSGPSYQELAFAQATLWNQAMLKIAKNAI